MLQAVSQCSRLVWPPFHYSRVDLGYPVHNNDIRRINLLSLDLICALQQVHCRALEALADVHLTCLFLL
jgi:hypothetical protein